jgi:subtilisin family serine protease
LVELAETNQRTNQPPTYYAISIHQSKFIRRIIMKPRQIGLWGLYPLIILLLMLSGCGAPAGAPASAPAGDAAAPAAQEAAPPAEPAETKAEPADAAAALDLPFALAKKVITAESAAWAGASIIADELMLYGDGAQLDGLAAKFALTASGERVDLAFLGAGRAMQLYQTTGDLPADQVAEQINEQARSEGIDVAAEPNLLLSVSTHGGSVFGSPSYPPLTGPETPFDQQWIWFDQGIRLPAEQTWTGKGVTVGVFDTCPATQPAWVDQVEWITKAPGANPIYLEHGASAAALVDYVAPAAQIELYCVLSADGYGTLADLIAGIAHFINQHSPEGGRAVINLSLGVHGVSAQLEAILDRVHALGFVIVAAAGNQGDPTAMNIPAAYHTVIGVAGHTIDRQPSNFTNLGEIAAPAGGNLSAAELAQAPCAALPDRFIITPADSSPTGYLCWQGTSFASPLVSGAAALLLEKDPALTADDVAAKLYGTAEVGDPIFGAGIMDVTQALQ